MSEEQVLLIISCKYVIFCEELGNSADIISSGAQW